MKRRTFTVKREADVLMSVPLTFRNRCVETAGGKSVQVCFSLVKILCLLLIPLLILCNDSPSEMCSICV
jgi:hypothetical protein